jgi:GNAT superfamily N-acetyltransferase
MSLAIRAAVAEDGPTLVAFNQELALSTEGKTLDALRLGRGIDRLLADPARGRYLVAEWDHEPVGCLMLTREWSDWRDGWFWWIQSVFVSSTVRRRGVYRALHDHVLTEARAAGDVCGLRLNVEHGNDSAKSTYQAVGMGPGPYEMYEVDFTLDSSAT